MANQVAKGGEYEDFEAKGLAPVDFLIAEGAREVDLAVLERVGLISAEAKARVEAQLPNHAEIFSGAFEREGVNGDRSAAFKRAFSVVYGRFLLEDRAMDLRKNKRLIGAINEHLKMPIGDDEHLIKRPALAGVMARLQKREALASLGNGGKNVSFGSDVKVRRDNELKAASDNLKDAMDAKKAAKGHTDFFVGLDKRGENGRRLEELRSNFTRTKVYFSPIESDFTLAPNAEILGEDTPYHTAIAKQISELDSEIQAGEAELANPDLARVNGRMAKVPLAKKADEYLLSVRRKVRERNLEALRARRDTLTADLKKWDTLVREVVGSCKEFSEGESFIGTVNVDAVPGLRNILDRFKARFQDFLAATHAAGDVDFRTLGSLVADYGKEMAEVEKVINDYVGATTDDEAKAAAEVKRLFGLKKDVDGVEMPARKSASEVVEAAFGKASKLGDLMGKRRKMKETEVAAKEVEAVYAYFSDRSNFDVLLTASQDAERSIGNYKDEVSGPANGNKARPFAERWEDAKTELGMAEKNFASTSEEAFQRTNIQGKKLTPEQTTALQEDNTKKRGVYLEAKKLKSAEFKNLNAIFERSKALFSSSQKFVAQLRAAKDLGIKLGSRRFFNDDKFDDKVFKAFDDLEVVDANGSDPSGSFEPVKFKEFASNLAKYLGDGRAIEALQQAFDKKIEEREAARDQAKQDYDDAKAGAESSKNLSDTEVARRITRAMVDEEYPDMDDDSKAMLVEQILAEDVHRATMEGGYEELARSGSEQLLATVGNRSLKEIFAMKYQVEGSDKAVEPLKGFRPEDFESIAAIDKLFGRGGAPGRIGLKNGFFALAALKRSGMEGTESLQVVHLTRRLKALLAQELGADEAMSELAVKKKVDEVFEKQLKAVDYAVESYLEHKAVKQGDLDESSTKEFNLLYKELKEKRRVGELSIKEYHEELAKLVERVKDSGLEGKVDFSMDTTLAEFWNSRQAQWLRDLSGSVGKFAGKKALSLGSSALSLAGKGIWGGTKLAAETAARGTVGAVKAAVKYPFLLAAKPLIGVLNFFRKNKWQPLPGIIESARGDIANVFSYTGGKIGASFEASKNNVLSVPAEKWGAVSFERGHFKDKRQAPEELTKAIEEAKKGTELESLTIGGDPILDLTKYKAEMEKLVAKTKPKSTPDGESKAA